MWQNLEIMHTWDICHTIKILEVDIEITLIVEEILVIRLEVVRDIRNNYNNYRRNN